MKRILPIIFIFSLLFSTSVFSAPEIVDMGAPEVALTEEEKLVYDNFSQISVFMKGNRYPYSYYEDGGYRGIYPDYLEKISELSGISFNYVPYESDAQIESYFTLGKADALVNTYGDWQGLYKTTEPYTVLEYNLVAPPGSDISKDYEHTVAVSSMDIMLEHYIEENYPMWTIVPCKDIRGAVQKVSSGKADMTFITVFDLQVNISLFPYKNTEVLDDFSLFIPVSMAISDISCPDAMVTLLNKFIVCEPMQDNDTIIRKYILNNLYVPNLAEFFLIHKEILIAIFIILAVLIVSAILRYIYMRRETETDPLTRIWNKGKFIKEAEKRLKGSNDEPYLLAVLDVERFKIINDRFGIEVGNQTLTAIAKKITSLLKGNGICAKGSSDKFIILIQDTPYNRAILEDIANMDINIHNATYYKLPIKVGVCPVRYSEMNGLDVTSFIDRATIANSKIKGHQDMNISYFTKKMGEKLAKENELETIMRKSLKNNEFLVYYQPKYSLDNNKIIGAEALVRWNHPKKGLISPGDFIPLFERNGFIVDVDFYVYEKVMQMLNNRIKNHKKVVPVSMNVSRCHLNSPTFTGRLEELADKYGIPKDVIEMEITESIFGDEDKAAITLMYDLKKRNFTLSMDDFGSGYSSLNLLRELPIDTLKIDKAFLDQMDDSDRSRVIVEEIITMATKINIKTICEGVETEQQRDFLKQAGCNMAQGFFYARPMPQNEFEDLLDAET